MLVAAVKALAAQSPALKDADKGLLPDVKDVREISVHIAKAVIRQAVEEGVAGEEGIPEDEADLEEWIREQMVRKFLMQFPLPVQAGSSKSNRAERSVCRSPTRNYPTLPILPQIYTLQIFF